MAQKTMQGLTPTITIIVPDAVDLTEAAHVYVSFKQGGLVWEKTEGITVAAHAVDVYLEQADTLAFAVGAVEVQINWTYANGQRGATKPVALTVLPNHLLEVLP